MALSFRSSFGSLAYAMSLAMLGPGLGHAQRPAEGATGDGATADGASADGASADGAKADGAKAQPIGAVIAAARIGDTVAIAGRATVPSGALQPRHLLIAVSNGGSAIWVYRRATTLRVDEGDSVEARGTLATYRGSLELIATSVRVVPAQTPVLVAPDTSWPGAVVAEGRLLRVRGVVGARGESEGGRWLRLHHKGAGDSLTLWVPWTHHDPPVLADVQRGDQLEVTGNVSVYLDNPGDAAVTQIIPRRNGDVRTVGYSRQVARRVRDGVVAFVLAGLLVLTTIRVVTRRQARALRETEQRYRQLLQLSPDAVLVHDRARVLFANAAAARLLGVADEHVLAGRDVDSFIGDGDREAPESRDGEVPTASSGRVRTTLTRSDGSPIDVELASSPCRYHDRDAVVVVARDIGPQLRNERELRELALLDELTGLHNRRGFSLFAEGELRRLRERGGDAVVLFADLDGLKYINDHHGHAAGDDALRRVARALREVVGEQGLTARWSGDEFVALTSDPAATSGADDASPSDDARAAAFDERLAVALSRHSAPAAPFAVTVSIGACRVAADGHDAIADAVDVADSALYRRRGRDIATVGES